ncbi:MAG: hypothetical protein ACLFPL_01010 [Candidatus Nanoarchaeia archaeon]
MVNLFYNKQYKKGQAAIEFLMTYGWMLLVVLIVGALIFSFVDFGQLLPNTVDLNNNFRGNPAEVRASESENAVLISFTYNGNERVIIDPSDTNSTINGELNERCDMVWVKNTDTDTSYDDGGSSTSPSPNFGISQGTNSVAGDGPYFLRSHTGIAEFDCDAGSADLAENGILEGTITVKALNQRTDFPVLSRGNFRASIEE